MDGDTVWVSVVAGPSAAATNEASGVHALPPTACEPVVAGKGESDLLVVSDLPLQGGIRITATQMAQAIAFMLREREFRAGRFRVAYQSCDDSIARTGLYDEAKCAANARAYADNADVVGIIGTLNSPCALAAVPVLDTAEGGALGMVSPLNSFVGLTREGVGVHRHFRRRCIRRGSGTTCACTRPTTFKGRRSRCGRKTSARSASSSSTTASPATGSSWRPASRPPPVGSVSTWPGEPRGTHRRARTTR